MKLKGYASLILAACGAAIGLVIGLFVLRPTPSDLQITSAPPGASIYLDQNFEGVTPHSLSGLTRGEHQLRLSHSGYHDENQPITVESGESSIHVDLKPIPPKGTLVVQSNPPGAFVWLDGERGPQTPARFDVSAGTHAIKVEKSGWLPHEQNVEIVGKEEKRISVKLVWVKVAYYLDAIKREPNNTTNYVELGRLYIRAGELENGFQTLLKAVEAFGRSGSALDKGFGEMLTSIRNVQPNIEAGKWQQLIQGLRKALYSREPNDRFARSAYEFFTKIERWKEAEELATYYLEHGKTKSLYYRWRMLARMNLGRDQEVMNDLEGMIEAMSERERKVPFDFNFYYALLELQRWKELLKVSTAYIEWQPEAIQPRLYKLEALGWLGESSKFDEDFRLFVKTIRGKPNPILDYAHLRPILVKLERWAEMAEICRISFEAQPEDLVVRFWYLESLLRSADWKLALHIFQALSDEGHLLKAKAPMAWARYPEALQAVLFTGAWAMMELGETEKLETLLKQYEFDLDTHFWVATIRGELWRRKPIGVPPKAWLEAKPCAAPPVIDGRLDDAAWAAAGRTSAFFDLHHPQKNEEQARILATWDDKHLYFGITGYGQNRERGHPIALDQYPNRRLEMFIDTNADYRTYKQFMFHVRGQILNFDCHKGAFDRGNGFTERWHPKFKLAATHEGEDHVYELAIPFSTLGEQRPKAGAIWGFNLIYLGTSSVTFAPIGGAFHHPVRFGFLVYR